MPKARKGGKIRDKWRDKVWVTVETPTYFGSTPVAYIPLTDPAKAAGRIVETTLFDLVKKDPQQYGIKLYFQIDKVEGGKATTFFKGHEYAREYLRSLIRRGSTMVNLINNYVTKDGAKVRVYVVFFTQGKINTSRKRGLRRASNQILIEKTGSLTYDQFAQEAVLGKIGSDIFNEAKKICHLRHVGVRKTKLLHRPVEAVKIMEAAPVAEAAASS